MIYGYGVLAHMLRPIQRFMDDPPVTEIVCQKPGEIGVERAGQWEWHHIPEFNERRLDAIGIVAGNLLSKSFDAEHPICRTILPGGRKRRLTYLRSPVTETPCFCIRIPSSKQGSVYDEGFQRAFREPMSTEAEDMKLRELFLSGDNNAEFFHRGVLRKLNFGAIGETGHGKTYFLRTIMAEIDVEDRLVTAEDSPEFGPLHLRNRVEMIYGSAGITAIDLIRISLRLRPDRIAIQELSGNEIWAYKRILAAGYRGSFTSWHATREAPFTPLVDMAKETKAGRAMDAADLEEFFKKNIDVVVHCHKNRATNTYSNKIVWYGGLHHA